MYDIKETSKTKKFHKQRVMFAIHDNKLYIANKNTKDSHADWFEKEGWNPKENMDLILRGYIDQTGIYFYRGFDFTIKDTDINIIKQHINELKTKLNLNENLNVYGGLIKSNKEEKWSPENNYGKLKDL